MGDYISGIQQIGIGVHDAQKALKQYASLFGMSSLVFDDTGDAILMTPYTGGQVYRRRALLTLNLKGGGGFEIWQFKNRIPAAPAQPTLYGDLGINAAKIKCTDVAAAHATFSRLAGIDVSELDTDPQGAPHFWVRDEWDNLFQMVRGDQWFQQTSATTGGVAGAVIGVRHMERSVLFYKTLLNGASVVYDREIVTGDGRGSAPQRYRAVLLQKPVCDKGAFGKLLGPVSIELVQCLQREPVRVYAQRFWGDCGFIHLCFDVFNMCALKQRLEAAGYRFTIDSKDSFGMASAAGRFCYVPDPDGTLIELVETHKIPIVKKLGLHLNLKKRNLEKPLPDWIIKLLALSKVK